MKLAYSENQIEIKALEIFFRTQVQNIKTKLAKPFAKVCK
jgi:hypothetical protein